MDSKKLTTDIKEKDLKINEQNEWFAYLDADLSKALQECLRRDVDKNGKPARDISAIDFNDWSVFFTGDALDFCKRLKKFHRENFEKFKNDLKK